MSSPHDRLLGEAAAERLHLEASAILSGPTTLPMLESMAAAVVTLSRDRQARIELARIDGATAGRFVGKKEHLDVQEESDRPCGTS